MDLEDMTNTTVKGLQKNATQTINPQQFVKLFTAGPCSMEGCTALTEELQGRLEKKLDKAGSSLKSVFSGCEASACPSLSEYT